MAKVLIVDDDEAIRELVSIVLSEKKYTVHTVADGEQALVQLAKENYDVAIVDLKMPGPIDGMGILARQKEVAPFTKIVVLTAYPSYETAIQALRESVADYLEKPIHPSRLVECVESLTTNFEAAGFEVNVPVGSVKYHGEALKLTKTQFKLLTQLVRFPDMKFTYADLAKAVHNKDVSQKEAMNALRSHMSRLRSLLREVTGKEIIASGYSRSFTLLVD